MASTKIFRRMNDAKVNETWTPILEGYGADLKKSPWLAEYAHYDAVFRNTPTGSLFEQVNPGLFFQQPGSVLGMGAAVAPTPGQTPFTGGTKNAYSASGSGDKFQSLMPVAIQVAAKTVGFDMVSVIPMDVPVGFLPYLDYVYAGGLLNTEFEPYLIKIEGITPSTAIAGAGPMTTFADATIGQAATIDDGGDILSLTFAGFSRVDGNPVFKVISDGSTSGTKTIADYVSNGNTLEFSPTDTFAITTEAPSLTSALENHISGFTSVSDANYAATPFQTNYLGATGSVPSSMKRQESEVSKFRQMGIKMFTKFVEAETDQVSIGATVEQIQDLNRVWNYDVISMLENVGVNDIAQSINKRIVDRVFTLADTHSTKVNQIEGAGVTTLALAAGAGGFENISTLQRRFVTKVLELANLIYHRGRFGAGTFMVTNGRLASALADVSGYSIAQAPVDMGSGAGQLYPAGKVWGVQVMVDPNLKWGDSRVAIGRKGSDEEPGIKFMPYIMAESLQTISEGTMSPKLAIKSRYAITEAGWHPETQYISMNITGNIGVLTGSVAPTA